MPLTILFVNIKTEKFNLKKKGILKEQRPFLKIKVTFCAWIFWQLYSNNNIWCKIQESERSP